MRQQSTEVPAGANGRETAASKKTKRKLPRLLLLVGLIILAGWYGSRWYLFNASHVTTDDAQVGGDIYTISARVSGYVLSIPVSTNQFVQKGALLAKIDDRELQAAVEQARANLDALIASARASGQQVSVTRQTAGASESQAAAGVAAARAGVQSAETKTQAARVGVAAAEAGLNAALASEQASRHAAAASAAQVLTARSQLASALAGLSSAEANERRAASDAARLGSLYQQGAISAQQHDAAVSQMQTADAQVEQARQAVSEARARISQMKAAAESAGSAVEQARAAVEQARVNILQSREQVAQSLAGVAQARGQFGQSEAMLQSARSAPAQVSVSSSTAASGGAKIAQAQAALDAALVQLSYAEIRSPSDGYVTQKSAEPGQLVQPGQPLMSIVPLTGEFVDANLKETQLTDIKVGQPAEVRVDAYPGRIFRGRVKSLSPGTGATFSLLPPENASGNFVKVVQRVPVRIAIDEKSDPDHALRLGMSVDVTIQTR